MRVFLRNTLVVLTSTVVLSFSLFLLYVLAMDLSGISELVPDLVSLSLIFVLTYVVGYLARPVGERLIHDTYSGIYESGAIVHYVGIFLFYSAVLILGILEFGLGQGTGLESEPAVTVGLASMMTAAIVSVPGWYGSEAFSPSHLSRENIASVITAIGISLSLLWGTMTLLMGVLYVVGASVLSTAIFRSTGPDGQTLGQEIGGVVTDLAPGFLLAYADIVVLPAFGPLANTVFGRIIAVVGLLFGTVFMAAAFVGAGYEFSINRYAIFWVIPDEDDDSE